MIKNKKVKSILSFIMGMMLMIIPTIGGYDLLVLNNTENFRWSIWIIGALLMAIGGHNIGLFINEILK